MKIVIQCAGKKRSHAGHLTDGRGARVFFVAHPEMAAASRTVGRYCQPDDSAEPGSGTWREVLARHNAAFFNDGSNPDRLLPAGDLYQHPVYGNLVSCFLAENVFILSAGWGLVRADYLLPTYNITFSKQRNVPKECQRAKLEPGWLDFNQLLDHVVDGEEVQFFGTPNYLDLFYSLSARDITRGKFVIHHKASLRQQRDGYLYQQYFGRAKTNWHYLAADEFMSTVKGGPLRDGWV